MDTAESHPPRGAPLQPEMGLTPLFKRVNQQYFRYDFGRMATIRVLLFDSNFGNTTDREGCLHGHDYSHTPSLAWGYDFVPVVLAKGGERVGLNLNRHHFATPSNFPCNIIHINVQKGMCSVHGKLRFETNGRTLISVDIKAFQY